MAELGNVPAQQETIKDELRHASALMEVRGKNVERSFKTKYVALSILNQQRTTARARAHTAQAVPAIYAPRPPHACIGDRGSCKRGCTSPIKQGLARKGTRGAFRVGGAARRARSAANPIRRAGRRA